MTDDLEEIKQRQDQLEDCMHILESRLSMQEGPDEDRERQWQSHGTISI